MVIFETVVLFSVIKVREYRLLSGIVTRDEGFIEKGNTTDVSNHSVEKSPHTLPPPPPQPQQQPQQQQTPPPQQQQQQQRKTPSPLP